jgi:hypothetical protein
VKAIATADVKRTDATECGQRSCDRNRPVCELDGGGQVMLCIVML